MSGVLAGHCSRSPAAGTALTLAFQCPRTAATCARGAGTSKGFVCLLQAPCVDVALPAASQGPRAACTRRHGLLSGGRGMYVWGWLTSESWSGRPVHTGIYLFNGQADMLQKGNGHVALPILHPDCVLLDSLMPRPALGGDCPRSCPLKAARGTKCPGWCYTCYSRGSACTSSFPQGQ